MALYGSVAPSRITLTLTGVPLGPRSSSATPGDSIFVVSLPSTATITSPRRIPAFHAGEPTNGSITTTFGPSIVICMPTP